jgi:hypothetical protein
MNEEVLGVERAPVNAPSMQGKDCFEIVAGMPSKDRKS